MASTKYRVMFAVLLRDRYQDVPASDCANTAYKLMRLATSHRRLCASLKIILNDPALRPSAKNARSAAARLEINRGLENAHKICMRLSAEMLFQDAEIQIATPGHKAITIPS
jgi:hypothetical protein